MQARGGNKWEVEGQLGHRGGVTERYAEFAPDYQHAATDAIEASGRSRKTSELVPSQSVGTFQSSIDIMVPVERIELPTFGLQNRCSTAELNRHPIDCICLFAMGGSA